MEERVVSTTEQLHSLEAQYKELEMQKGKLDSYVKELRYDALF